MFRHPISICRARFLSNFRLFRCVQGCCGAEWGSGGRQQPADPRCRLRGSAARRSRAAERRLAPRRPALYTGGPGLRFLTLNLVPHFLVRKSGPTFPLNMTSAREGGARTGAIAGPGSRATPAWIWWSGNQGTQFSPLKSSYKRPGTISEPALGAIGDCPF